MELKKLSDLKFLKPAIKKHPTQNLNLEYLDKNSAIAALVINHSETETLLVKQYRIAAMNEIFEIPAGIIENGESAISTLYRELREETGYSKEDYEIIYSSANGFYVSPGYTTEKIYIYIVKLNSDSIIPKPLRLDDTEELINKWFPLEDLEKTSMDMKTVFAYNLYKNL